MPISGVGTMGNASQLASFGIALFAAGVVTLAFGALFSAFWPCFHKYQRALSPEQYARAIFGYAAIPLVVGLAVFVSCAAVPSAAGFNIVPDHCHFEVAIRNCLPHAPTVKTATGLVPVFIAFMLLASIVAGVFARRMLKHRRMFQDLERCSLYDKELDAWVIQSDALSAFCIGILRKRVIVSGGLFQSLSSDQLRIVLEHERGHARRADGLWILLLQLLALPFFPAARHGLMAEFVLSFEYACDRHAADRCGDSLAVADTLVRLGRIRLEQGGGGRQAASAALFSVFGQSLERRVGWLVRSPERRHFGPTMILERLICYAVIGACILAEPIHHVLEQALSLLMRG